ncbi:MAG: radical SAM protein [Verrucomicrobia bacterium]|nr:radical SAM protein [Verrucomicrobiota bacterium]
MNSDIITQLAEEVSTQINRCGIWNVGKNPAPAVISNNKFVHKSLSEWALNFVIGCGHGCRYCYVPSSSLNKQAAKLALLGVDDPDAQFGDYVFLRPWDEAAFLASLRSAENRPADKLKPDGNRAVMLCTTTDAYQAVRDPELQAHLRMMVRRSLELIRDHSTINVRILTRSPLVREDFDLLSSLGPRVMLGMSIPTLRNDLARVYEPAAPAPTQRLRVLQEAAKLGIPTFVAIAPVFPECDEADIRQTLQAVADAGVWTVFAEPVNIRAENVARIEAHAASLDIRLNTSVFKDAETWQAYAINTLKTIERIADEIGVSDRLHLWPDAALGTGVALKRLPPHQREAHTAWLNRYWNRVSEWPASASSKIA